MVQLRRDAAELGREAWRGSNPADAGHVRLLAATHGRQPAVLQRADGRHARLRRAARGLHTETGPGVYEAAIAFSEALEQADRAILFKTGAREIGKRYGIMPSFMAKWNQQYPGCSGHLHQSLSDGKKNLFYDAKARAQ